MDLCRHRPAFHFAAAVALLLLVCQTTVSAQSPAAIKADFRIDTTLVTMPVTVTDRNGRLIPNLTREDFLVKEQGVPQDVRYVWQDVDLPLTIGLIVDISSSQMGLLDHHRDLLAQFLTQVLGPQDRAFLVSVNEQARLAVDLTDNPDALRAGVAGLDPKNMQGKLFGDPCHGTWQSGHHPRNPDSCVGTPIWDAVHHTARNYLRRESGRKAIVLITDGIDDNGSEHGLTDAIESAQAAGAAVYAIQYRSLPYLAMNPMVMMGLPFNHGMEKLALETGGRFYPNPKNQLAATFSEIEAELRSQYVVAYAPNLPPAPEGRLHKVEIRTKDAKLIVRSPKGYRVTPVE